MELHDNVTVTLTCAGVCILQRNRHLQNMEYKLRGISFGKQNFHSLPGDDYTANLWELMYQFGKDCKTGAYFPFTNLRKG